MSLLLRREAGVIFIHSTAGYNNFLLIFVHIRRRAVLHYFVVSRLIRIRHFISPSSILLVRQISRLFHFFSYEIVVILLELFTFTWRPAPREGKAVEVDFGPWAAGRILCRLRSRRNPRCSRSNMALDRCWAADHRRSYTLKTFVMNRSQ